MFNIAWNWLQWASRMSSMTFLIPTSDSNCLKSAKTSVAISVAWTCTNTTSHHWRHTWRATRHASLMVLRQWFSSRALRAFATINKIISGDCGENAHNNKLCITFRSCKAISPIPCFTFVWKQPPCTLPHLLLHGHQQRKCHDLDWKPCPHVGPLFHSLHALFDKLRFCSHQSENRCRRICRVKTHIIRQNCPSKSPLGTLWKKVTYPLLKMSLEVTSLRMSKSTHPSKMYEDNWPVPKSANVWKQTLLKERTDNDGLKGMPYPIL